MKGDQSKIDDKLREVLQATSDDDQVDVLVYPLPAGQRLQDFLELSKSQGRLDYNVLKFANCIAVKAKKFVIVELSSRDDIVRVTANPTFEAHF